MENTSEGAFQPHIYYSGTLNFNNEKFRRKIRLSIYYQFDPFNFYE